ncbi:hypothetical protein BCR35DRAFT_309101 [Leucosporidium creatinivorum]|uniref:Uncharacterized protein n=1 Tax=Leucosporidium creatinivorum TaxID=106004 RepID=A0A1Y2DPQ2_9BASI|nr:hypothetical protein BCR35DRAFT_309101 [Leucosporidium creatinivorum]
MKDLYNANAMNERVGALVSALDPEYDNQAGFHFLTTLVVDRTPDPSSGRVQPTLVVVAQGPGLWTTHGPPLQSDGKEKIVRSRRVLPTGRSTVSIEIQGIKCGCLLPWSGFPPDVWEPISHQPFSNLTGHHYGETSEWRLSNPIDFPNGLPIHFVFDVPYKEHLQRRFARYESFGSGIGRSSFAPAARASLVKPRLFNDDSSLMRSQQWTTERPPKEGERESLVSTIESLAAPSKRGVLKERGTWEAGRVHRRVSSHVRYRPRCQAGMGNQGAATW